MTKDEIIQIIKNEDLIFEGSTDMKGVSVLWFTSKVTGSTMIMKESDFSLEALRAKVEDHNKNWCVSC